MKTQRFAPIINPAVIALLLVFSSFALLPGDDRRLNSLEKALEKFLQVLPQQKVYLQLDKTVYYAGEDIWYKAYLVNGVTHKPDQPTTNLYVELVNARNERVQIQLLKLHNGAAYGDFVLKDTTSEGNYQIKAWSPLMNNYDKDFTFRKNLYIINPDNKNFISKEDIRFNKKFNRKLRNQTVNYDFQLFPEGGKLVAGIENVVAIKAVSGSGKGVDVEGKIVDSKGAEVVNFKSLHLGMGAFRFTPQSNMKYTALVKYPDGTESKYPMPEALPLGIQLMVNNLSQDGIVRITIHSTIPPTGDDDADKFLMITQTRGTVWDSRVIASVDGKAEIQLSKENAPPGIAQITLFNGRGMPVAERLIFCEDRKPLRVDMQAGQDNYPNSTELDIRIHSADGNPVAGNFSLAVTDADQVVPEPDAADIISFLLLTSDLKGVVEAPGYYFSNPSGTTRQALDCLMMSQGWRRFDWNKLLAGTYPKVLYPEEKGITVSGRITKQFFNRTVDDADVYLTVLEAYNDYFNTKVNAKGRFIFENLEYRDTISVVIEASRPGGRKNILIITDESEGPRTKVHNNEAVNQAVLEKGDNWKYANVRRPDYMAAQKEREEKLKKIEPYKIYGRADDVIYMDDLPDSYTDMTQVLQGRVPGVTVSGNNILIRGVNSLMLDNSPLFLIDGVPVDVEAFRSLNPRDVEFVEILKGPSAAIYGSRGSNGVIAVYTRHGEYMKRGYIDFKMLAYYTPREFYTPVNGSGTGSNDSQARITAPSTIYWNPNVLVDTSGIAKIKFRMPASHTRGRVTMEGLSLEGNPVRKEIILE